MLKRVTAREKFEHLISRFEPDVRKAFLEAIDDIKSAIVLRRIVERLEKGDIAGAIRAFGLDDTAAFRPLDRAIAQAFEGGGIAAVQDMPTLRDPEGHVVTIRFDVRNPAAESYLREHSSTLIRNIVEDQKNAIQIILEDGLRRGANPTQTALDIAGRVSRVTGKRENGTLGLTSVQAGYVAANRERLLAGSPDDLRHYLTLGRRDKRFDRSIVKHIKEGTKPSREEIARINGRYADGLLKLRADTIARFETAAAVGSSKKQAYLQAVQRGELDVNTLTKVWRKPPKTKYAREQHQEMDGQEVKFTVSFVAPDGTLIDFPCDPSAPIKHTANCRCDWDIRIDYFAGLK